MCWVHNSRPIVQRPDEKSVRPRCFQEDFAKRFFTDPSGARIQIDGGDYEKIEDIKNPS